MRLLELGQELISVIHEDLSMPMRHQVKLTSEFIIDLSGV